MLTVPLALRQREIEREIDELDPVLLGARADLCSAPASATGWPSGSAIRSAADPRHADAAGDLRPRRRATADELQRLVEAFNHMAGSCSASAPASSARNRLEAWAEMARQVAHDIKNPLTPIQLSAEHLRRVHRGSRASRSRPVLDTCVDTILTQVRLLRQIASEFSSFAAHRAADGASTSPICCAKSSIPTPGCRQRIELDVAPTCRR